MTMEVIAVDKINPENYCLVVDENNKVIIDKDKMYLQSKTGNQLFLVDKKIVLSNFELSEEMLPSAISSNVLSSPSTLSLCDATEQSTKRDLGLEEVEMTRNPWSRSHILRLLALYDKYEIKFKSSTIKNDKVWQMISNELGSHTPYQCKNKFKYLKQKYVEKKDNMGSSETGAKALKFEYFEEFDNIFGKDANVKPFAIASSSSSTDSINGSLSSSSKSNNSESVKKRKRSLLEKQLEKYDEQIKEREDIREKRHKEIIQRQDQALAIFEQIAQTFRTLAEK